MGASGRNDPSRFDQGRPGGESLVGSPERSGAWIRGGLEAAVGRPSAYEELFGGSLHGQRVHVHRRLLHCHPEAVLGDDGG